MRSELMTAATAAFLLIGGSAHAQETPAPAPSLGAKPPTVTFDDAIARATSHNPNFELASDEMRRAQALVEQARSSWLPSLNGNLTYTHLDTTRQIGTTIAAAQDSFNANLLLTVPIIQPRGWVATARAKDNRQIAKAVLEDTRRQVALLAGRAYLTVIGQKRVLESSIQARDTARAHEQFSESRLAGGVGNRLDAVRAAQERASTETTVQNQTLALSRAQEALGILLGENTPFDAADVTLAAPPTLAVAFDEAQHRSDIVASKERVESARKAVRDSYAEYLPILTGVAQPFYQNPATLTTPSTGWQVQLLLTLPIYDGGNRYGLKHERDALYDEAKTRLDAALRQARSEVRIGFEAMQRSDEALAKARDAARFAEEALQLSQLAYRAGATTNLEVVDAERRARDATTEAAIAEDAARQARLDLLAAAGRFP
ncbi:MAG: outer rane efflux protein [Myxococcaceae bacterium]|nr:outer rane efflux protein [Myxococcaceae bacterium]